MNASSVAYVSEWTPARVFLVISALWHIPLALAGFVYDRTFPIGADAAARAPSELVFGAFETNGWHTLAALIVGVVSLYYVLRPRHAREAALGLGLGHVGLVIMLILWDPSTFWIASNTADQVVHSSTAVGGIISGLLTARTVRATP
ncbi:MAG: DUF4383 domain-containing protein [Actinomycetota bacterium]